MSLTFAFCKGIGPLLALFGTVPIAVPIEKQLWAALYWRFKKCKMQINWKNFVKTSQIKHKSHILFPCLSLFPSPTGMVLLLTLRACRGKNANKLWFSPTVVAVGVFSVFRPFWLSILERSEEDFALLFGLMSYLKCCQTACVPLMIASWRVLPTVLISWWSHRTIFLFPGNTVLIWLYLPLNGRQFGGWTAPNDQHCTKECLPSSMLTFKVAFLCACCKFVHSLYYSAEVQ